MLNRFTILLLILIVSVNFGQDVLYKNDKFTVSKNKVAEGGLYAEVISPTKIVTNNTAALMDGFDRLVKFKFAINGEDNEAASGQDHELYLNPVNGKFVSPVFRFGKPDPVGSGLPQGKENPVVPGEKFDVTFRVDMSEIKNSFEKHGYFVLNDGTKLLKEDFTGVYIAGGTTPLTWDFGTLTKNNNYKLNDVNGDGIYEITLSFVPSTYRALNGETGYWELSKDISQFAKLSSDIPLLNAMYNLSLEELLEDVREDGAFMAGAKWHGVWTRDISYSIHLSLAAIMPDAAKVSLMAKVKDGRIIQDTGTGGSWPVSSDRMTWAIAAWEVYLTTGDKDWLKTIYPIIKKSILEDEVTLYNEDNGLASGESSFLDWREQSYPKWMDPKDIYVSKNLGTNVVHYLANKILNEIELQLKVEKTEARYQSLEKNISEHFWSKEVGYHGQFLYGRDNLTLSPRSETLGEALAAIAGLGDTGKDLSAIANIPVTQYGPTCFYPQIKEIPPYHNNGIWPFVVAYYTWAGALSNNENAANYGMASIYRPAGLFLTNKENMVAQTGNFEGTEINSNRQLWSVAGNLATVYRVLFGMHFTHEGLQLKPFVPESYEGEHRLSGFKYRNSVLDITVKGFGNDIKKILIDGKEADKALIPGSINGKHTIQIVLNGKHSASKINLVENKFTPLTPVVKLKNDRMEWSNPDNAKEFHIYKNSKKIASTKNTYYKIKAEEYLDEYQVLALCKDGLKSFLSEPVRVIIDNKIAIFKPETKTPEGYTEITRNKNRLVEFIVNCRSEGVYVIDFLYANGEGPINTDNNCAIRMLKTGNQKKAIVFPQRGINKWDDWGYSNSARVKLKKGENKIYLKFNEKNENMDSEINRAFIKHLRMVPIKQS